MSAHKTEGNGVGDVTVPPVKLIDLERCRRREEKPAVKCWDVGTDGWRLSVNVKVCDTVTFVWETVLIGCRLFVEVPKFILPDGSKESFVRLLEFAEDELKCSHVIVYFRKDRPDRASLVRVFMFLGFTVLVPGHSLIPAASADMMYLACEVDDDGGGDE